MPRSASLVNGEVPKQSQIKKSTDINCDRAWPDAPTSDPSRIRFVPAVCYCHWCFNVRFLYSRYSPRGSWEKKSCYVSYVPSDKHDKHQASHFAEQTLVTWLLSRHWTVERCGTHHASRFIFLLASAIHHLPSHLRWLVTLAFGNLLNSARRKSA